MPKLVLFVLVLLLLDVHFLPAQGFNDEFNGSIDARWQWVRPDVTRQLIIGSQLTIITQNGALYSNQFNNARNLLLQEAPQGTYVLETKVSFSADSTFHNAGLLYYQDDDNFVNVAKGFYLGFPVALMMWEEGGNFVLRTVEIANNSTLYLRLNVFNSGSFTGEFSTDRMTWTSIATAAPAFPGSAAKVGIKAANGEGVNVSQRQIPARFDYFRVSTTVAVEPGLQAQAAIPVFQVYPHPVLTGEPFYLHTEQGTPGTKEITVYSLAGIPVLQRRIEETSGNTYRHAISTVGFAPGLYIIALRTPAGVSSSMLTVLR